MNSHIRLFVLCCVTTSTILAKNYGPPDIEITTAETPEVDPITFAWASPSLDRSSDEVPNLHVTFADGSKDRILLNRHNAVDMGDSDEDPCSFMGSLEKEPESVVAVTGCPHERSYRVTITSLERADVSLQVNSEGKSVRVRNLLSGEVDSVKSILEESPKKGKYVSERAAIPKQFYMRLVLGYSGTFLGAVSHNRNKAHRYLGDLMTHLQAFYHAPSLKYRVTFDAPAPIVDLVKYVGVSQSTSENLDELSELTVSTLKSTGNGQHLAVFVKDKSGDMTLGMAYMNAICVSTYEKQKTSIIEHQSDVQLTAKIMAHELGHNFGFAHDDGSCNGIMAPTTAGGDTWSTCSVRYLEAQYKRAVEADGSFCLSRANPKSFGGSWAPWGEYSMCTKNCGGGTKTRSRLCIGPSCPGGPALAVDTAKCNSQACAACSDKPDENCEQLAELGWCGDFQKMKGKCDKSCNFDKLPTATCMDYKTKGWCEKGHVNFNYLMANCGLTCGAYCS